MKSKMIKALKWTIFVALFCVIYVGMTRRTENIKREAITELEGQTNLDTLVNDLIVETFTDSLTITDYAGFDEAVDSIKIYNYNPIKQFLYTRCIDSTGVKEFKADLVDIVRDYRDDVELLSEYKIEHNNLITRWPSNMAVVNL